MVADELRSATDQAAQRAQFKKEMIKFTRLLWSIDWETALKQLVTQPPFQQAFGGWLQQNSPSDVGALQAAAQGNPEAVDALAAEAFPKFVQSKAATTRRSSRAATAASCSAALQSAAEGKLQTAPKEALSDGAYFADNHKAMLEEIGVKAVAKPGLFGRMFGRK